MQRAEIERGQQGSPSTSLASPRLLPDVVVGLPAPAPQRPGARRKNAFPNGWEIYGAQDNGVDIPDKATRYALPLSPRNLVLPLSLSRARALPCARTYTYTYTCTGLNNFYSLFGQTRYTMRRDVSILERPFLPADSGQIYGARADHLGWIVRGECVQCSRLRSHFFSTPCNPFRVIFLLRNCEDDCAGNSLFATREARTILLLCA